MDFCRLDTTSKIGQNDIQYKEVRIVSFVDFRVGREG